MTLVQKPKYPVWEVVGGPIDSVRGKNVEPREENDPNPNQK